MSLKRASRTESLSKKSTVSFMYNLFIVFCLLFRNKAYSILLQSTGVTSTNYKRSSKSKTGSSKSKPRSGPRQVGKSKQSRVVPTLGKESFTIMIVVLVAVFVGIPFILGIVYFSKSTGNNGGNSTGKGGARQSEYAQHFCNDYPGTFLFNATAVPKVANRDITDTDRSLWSDFITAFKSMVSGASRKILTFLVFDYTMRPVKEPTEHGFACGRTFFVEYKVGDENVRLGAWFIPPQDKCGQPEEDSIQADQLVVLFAHGRLDTRDVPERVALYKALSNSTQLKVHVIAFDYRKCGDSSDQELTVQGLVNDTLAVYSWMRNEKKIDRNQIVIWGHSLGTQVVPHALALLEESDAPLCVVFEASFPSFNRLFNHVLHNLNNIPFLKLEKIINNAIADNPDLLGWDAGANIPFVKSPILLLSSTQDYIISHVLSEELYQIATSPQPAGQPPAVAAKTKHYLFGDAENLGHKEIPLGKNFSAIVKNYFQFIYC